MRLHCQGHTKQVIHVHNRGTCRCTVRRVQAGVMHHKLSIHFVLLSCGMCTQGSDALALSETPSNGHGPHNMHALFLFLSCIMLHGFLSCIMLHVWVQQGIDSCLGPGGGEKGERRGVEVHVYK